MQERQPTRIMKYLEARSARRRKVEAPGMVLDRGNRLVAPSSFSGLATSSSATFSASRKLDCFTLTLLKRRCEMNLFPAFSRSVPISGCCLYCAARSREPARQAFTDLHSVATSLGNTYRILADNHLSIDQTEIHRRGCVGGSRRAIHLPVCAAGPCLCVPEFFEHPQRS